MRICFLDYTDFQYSYKDINSPKLRGAETILINLSENLKKIGHDVIVFNNCPKDIHVGNNNWYNLNYINNKENNVFDVSIANGDINLFDKIVARKKFVISYSLQSIEKFIRKKQFLAYFKHRPQIFLIGEYHKQNRSKLISLFGSKVLELAIDDAFIKTNLINSIDPDLAIFTSRSDRNLNRLINIWNNHIYPKYKKGKLLITPTNNIKEENSISFRKMNTKELLIKDLLRSRIFLIPGHKAELYCLAAEEARELCIPIVTLGIGSLSERVIHNNTGFIAKNDEEFSNYTIELFKNNDLWNKLRSNLISLRGSKKWDLSTKKFLDSIK